MSTVATTYARAFTDVVFDAHLDPERCLSELRGILARMTESPDLHRVWQNPAISLQQKRRLLETIAERDGISHPVRNLMAVLINHRRMRFLDRVIRQLEKDLDERLGFAQAEIVSARELGEPARRALETQVEKLTGMKVKAQYARDASLLGGAIVRIGSTTYDGSVLGQLERIRESLRS